MTAGRSWLPLLASALFVLPLLPSPSPGQGQVVATVGEHEIRATDLRQAAHRLRHYHPDPREVLQPLIDRKILRMEAESLGLHLDSQVVTAVDRASRRWLAKQVYAREVSGRAVVSEQEMRAYYRERGLSEKRERRASHIVVDSLEEALRLRRRLMAGADFAHLARQASRDTLTAPKGGDLGFWQPGGRSHSPFLQQLFALQVGEVSQPYADAAGNHHLITVTEERPLGFERQKQQILRALRAGKRDQLWTAYLDEQADRFGLAIDPEALQDLLRSGRLAVEGLPRVSSPDLHRPLARYRGGQVTLGEYARILERSPPKRRPSPVDGAAVARFLRLETAVSRLLPIVARETGLDSTRTFRTYVAEKREEVLIERLRQVRVEDVLLTPQVVASYYESHLDDFAIPERKLFEVGVTASREQSLAIARRVRQGEEMVRVLGDYPLPSNRWRQFEVFHVSPTDTAVTGPLGQRIAGVRGLAVGEVKAPVPITFPDASTGYLVVHAFHEEPARPLPLADRHTRESIREELRRRRRQELNAAFADYMAGLRQRYSARVTVDEPALQASATALQPPGE